MLAFYKLGDGQVLNVELPDKSVLSVDTNGLVCFCGPSPDQAVTVNLYHLLAEKEEGL